MVVRFGENVLSVLERVKRKIKEEIEPSLPEGVKIVVTYDRSDLIYRSIDTVKDEIIKLSIAVSVVSIVFLYHLPSAIVVILTLPVAVIISFICMYYLRVTSNIMSLSGIAIAIGAMVDASIIMVENAHKRLEEWQKPVGQGNRLEIIIDAAKEVGPSLFFSLLVITVAFLPVFTLGAQAGRLFKPLAYTKTFTMLFASLLAITFTPALMTLLLRGKIRPEERNPLIMAFHKLYEPVVNVALRFKKAVIIVGVSIVFVTLYPFIRLGSEFMPPLYEGALFYMPVTVPGSSISEVSRLLQLQNKILKQIPEVAQVFGRAGRAETAIDPAPLEMFETVINLKPQSEWRPTMTVERLKDEMNEALTIPGLANSFTMPIKARIDMLSTGIRTPVGIKVMGPRLDEIERIGLELETHLKDIPGTRSVYAERITTGYFLDFDIKRDEIARYGLTVDEVQEIIQSAIGGMNLTTVLVGRERYPVSLRYARDFRGDVESLIRLPVPVLYSDTHGMGGTSGVGTGTLQIPLGQLADIRIVKSPTQIKSEDGLPLSYVYIDVSGRDIGGYVKEAKKRISSLKIPEGLRLQWSGEYEHIVKTYAKLKIVIPLTVLVIFLLVYLNTKSLTKTAIVLLAVPFSLVGSFWLLYLLDYNISVAVWVGILALAGLDAEACVVMLLYLELAYEKYKKGGRLRNIIDLKEAIMYGAVKRLRPKTMTVSVILAGLIPIMFGEGPGSDVMKRIEHP
ncbi:MAG: CusA/CzcA family heavy metal efflux RND transporter [Deltaproteobacteria bacterium]|nr:CusA/CzcA family heavy metal efflux RND transporter [Deltaproteobacteria bacterium]